MFKRKVKTNFAYGDWVKITDDFYKGFVGQICQKNGYDNKYLVKVQGNDPVYKDREFKTDVWIKVKHLERVDVEVERMKEDFWSQVKPKQENKKTSVSNGLDQLFGNYQNTAKTEALKQQAREKILAQLEDSQKRLSDLTSKRIKYNQSKDEFEVLKIDD